MAIHANIFGLESNFRDRYIPDYGILEKKVEAWKGIDLRIVLTMGSFDLIHEGHALYLEAAKKLGDLLIVGLDSDEKIRKRKKREPAVPEEERLRMLTHLRYVDVVTLKIADRPKWELIKLVRPHVLQATEGSYSEENIAALGEFCGRVVVQKRMGTTSTSARIRKFILHGVDQVKKELEKEIPDAISRVFQKVRGDSP